MTQQPDPSAIAEDSIARTIGNLTMRNAFLEADNRLLRSALAQAQEQLGKLVPDQGNSPAA